MEVRAREVAVRGIDVEAQENPKVAALLRILLTPYGLLLASAALSLVVWITPLGPVAKGFANRENLTLKATFLLVLWYGGTSVTAFVGFRIGRRMRPLPVFERIRSRPCYLYFTAVATIGVVGMYGRVALENPSLIWTALRTENFNLVRAAIPQGAGLATLRYAAILSGAIGCYELVLRRRISFLHVFNVLLLIASAANESRLSWVLAMLMILSLWAYGIQPTRRPLRGIAILVGITIVAFTAFNYIRNAHYYNATYKVHDPIVANVYQTATYLAAPFQVSVGVAAQSDSFRPRGSFNHVVHGGAEEAGGYWDTYGTAGISGADISRTTNPELVHSGKWAFLIRYQNRSRAQGSAYVWNSDVTALPVSTGEHYRLQAWVTGATARSPLSIGVRDQLGRVSQDGVVAGAHDLVTRGREKGAPLDATYVVPRGVAKIQLAVWKDGIAGGANGAFAVDDLRLTRIDADGFPERPPLTRGLARYLLPSYLPLDFDDVVAREELYRHFVDVDSVLTANSAFAPMYMALGRTAFPLMWLIGFAAAIAAGHAIRYRSYFFLAAVAIMYCFAELWRIFIFNFGMTYFLLLLLVSAAAVDPATPYVRRAVGALKQRVPLKHSNRST